MLVVTEATMIALMPVILFCGIFHKLVKSLNSFFACDYLLLEDVSIPLRSQIDQCHLLYCEVGFFCGGPPYGLIQFPAELDVVTVHGCMAPGKVLKPFCIY
jgi:hypothetical protein